MEKLLDYITKKLWDKNYPRPLLIFNIISIIQFVLGIGFIISAIFSPTTAPTFGVFSATLLVLMALGAVLSSTSYPQNYTWIIYFFHGIDAFLVVPLMFYSLGNLYGAIPLLLAITVIHSYILIDDLKVQVPFIAIQNVVNVTLLVTAYLIPSIYPQFVGVDGINGDIIRFALPLSIIYVVAIAAIFTYLFQSDYERTLSLVETADDASTKDDITGAYDLKYGMTFLESATKTAWDDNKKLCLFTVEIDCEGCEPGSYKHDLLLTCGFDSCRQVFPTDAIIVRYDDNKFFIIYQDCPLDLPVGKLRRDLFDKFDLTREISDIKDGSIKMGYHYLKYGMTVKALITASEESMKEKEAKN